MLWFLLWVLLVLGAAVVLGLLGRSLWRKVTALTRELGQAADRLGAVTSALDDLAGSRDREPSGRIGQTRHAEPAQDVRSSRRSPRTHGDPSS